MHRTTRILFGLCVVMLGACDGCEQGCGEAPAESSPQAAEEESKPVVEEEEEPPKYPLDTLACARMIRVAYAGAPGAAEGVERSKEDAKKRAEELRQKALEGGDFGQLAIDASDSWSMGAGAFGTHTYGNWPSAYEWSRDLVFDMKVGDISPVIETDRGFMIVQRCPVGPVAVRHVLVRYRDALGAGPKVRRSKERARKLAEKLHGRIEAGEDLGEVAKEHSDDEATAAAGGVIPSFELGSPWVEFEKAVLDLEPGERSEVVETRFGYHIIERFEPTVTESP